MPYRKYLKVNQSVYTASSGQHHNNFLLHVLNLNLKDLFMLMGHPVSAYAKFSEKLTFLTLRYTNNAHVSVRISGVEMLVIQKILRTYFNKSRCCITVILFE